MSPWFIPNSFYGESELRSCAGCPKNINIASQLFLIRLDKYWHEHCFRCKACNSPIPDCKFIAIEEDVWHQSCYKKLHNPDTASSSSCAPANQIICQVCRGLVEMMKHVRNKDQRNKKMLTHHPGDNKDPQQSEVVAETNPAASSSQPQQTTTAHDVIETDKVVNPHEHTTVEQLLRADSVRIYKDIVAKYGDIAKGFTSSMEDKAANLEKLCLIIKTLEETRVDVLEEQRLNKVVEAMTKIQKSGFDVGWLELHLTKLKKIMELKRANEMLERTRKRQADLAEKLNKSIRLKEEEVAKLKSEFAEAQTKYDKIYHEIMVIKMALDQDHFETLVDGLL